MKTSKLKKLAWAFFALALTATSASAQGFGYRNRVNPTTDVMPCLAQISDLTEQQKTEILALEQKHQEEMTELRGDRRSTVNTDEKTSIRQEMLEEKVSHQNAVKALLNPEQQKQYDLIQAGGGRYKNRTNPAGNFGYGRGARGTGNSGRGFRSNRPGRYN